MNSDHRRTGGDRRTRQEAAPDGVERRSNQDRRQENNDEFVTFSVADQLLGIDVAQVQEVIPPQKTTKVPHAPKAVLGLLNLRGQIVTAIDLRARLDLPVVTEASQVMNVILKESEELYSILVDSVGDVLSVSRNRLTAPPPTLDECWKEACKGVYRLNEGLLVTLNVKSLLDIKSKKGE